MKFILKIQSRKIRVVLKEMGVEINRKRVQRLMNVMGIESIAPKPNTSKRAPQHKVYPYLLRGLDIDHPNHVWATDITYIRTAKGFCYLVAVVDWYSRAVLSWRVSNTMDTDFCAEALQEAIDKYGCPEIFNTDQGSQFTSEKFTGILKTNGIEISMDGKGRALDNIIVERLWRTVKYEDIYPKGYETIREVKEGLTAFFLKYNNRRPHQTHDYKCPMEVYLKYESKMALAA